MKHVAAWKEVAEAFQTRFPGQNPLFVRLILFLPDRRSLEDAHISARAKGATIVSAAPEGGTVFKLVVSVDKTVATRLFVSLYGWLLCEEALAGSGLVTPSFAVPFARSA